MSTSRFGSRFGGTGIPGSISLVIKSSLEVIYLLPQMLPFLSIKWNHVELVYLGISLTFSDIRALALSHCVLVPRKAFKIRPCVSGGIAQWQNVCPLCGQPELSSFVYIHSDICTVMKSPNNAFLRMCPCC